jgi:hypothetical protein
MNQDAEHLRLLGIFHFVCAGLAALFACIPIIHLILGLVMVFGPETFGKTGNPPPAFLGWFFIAMALGVIFLGWLFAALLAWAGRCLQQRKHYTFCLVMGGIACLFAPVGTALGVFTLIVLSRPTVKALFAPRAQPPLT